MYIAGNWIKMVRFGASLGLACALVGPAVAETAATVPSVVTPLEGLVEPTSAGFDGNDVATIFAQNEHDAIFVEGYLHARERFFQMDFNRRAVSGTLGEMVGMGGLESDGQFRTLGLRRAAEASLAVQTPEVMAWLSAYADGVNAFLQNENLPLPPEYGALELTRASIPPWTEVDSLVVLKGLSASLSLDIEDDIARTLTYLTFDGVGSATGLFSGLFLFLGDLYRAAPFDPTVSIPGVLAATTGQQQDGGQELPDYLKETPIHVLQEYHDKITGNPLLRRMLSRSDDGLGSNWWIASGEITESGHPMIANDPHLGLETPAVFYEVNVRVFNGVNFAGTSLPGVPGVILGCTDVICWGLTNNRIDVTDVFREVFVADPTSPSGLSTIYDGMPEHIIPIPQAFNVNLIGDGFPDTIVPVPPEAGLPPVTLIVPRRNFGPIIDIDFESGTAFSVQYTGWGPTHELEALRRIVRSQNLDDFKEALQYFDVPSSNVAYADVHGNIAYFTSGELPIREDLQFFGGPAGSLGPFILRDGTHTLPHQWVPVLNPQPNQAVNSEILPFDEMPQVVNPESGYILNANNDPIGTTLDNISWNEPRPSGSGLLYLAPGYATGFRIGRIQRLFDDALAGGAKLTEEQFRRFQANNQLLDAEVFTPYLLQAFDNASAIDAPAALAALAANPGIAEAIGRLAAWDFSTPTGIQEGYDPGDDPFALPVPTTDEINASVAATIYSVWRGQVVKRVIDGTLAPFGLTPYAPGTSLSMSALRNLLDRYDAAKGVGASGLNFFFVPGVDDRVVARDIILLESLGGALGLLASDEFAPAFHNSTNQDDYRWGKLHRIVFEHKLGSIFSIPPNPFTGLSDLEPPDMLGLARAGGMGAVDASSHSARADGLNDFTFDSGPARRFVGTMTPTGPKAFEVIPGGQSGVLGSPFQADQLRLWLVNAYHDLPVTEDDTGKEFKVEIFREAPQIACMAPTIPADALSCGAEVAANQIATCFYSDGIQGQLQSDPDGPFGLGTTEVTVTCSTSTAVCPVSVVDVTAPTVEVQLPDQLWPPNHHLVQLGAVVTSNDACGSPTVVLQSITSNEPDNAVGLEDGDTINDIQGADFGTEDFDFMLRAERGTSGGGRLYNVAYTAVDSSGNETTKVATVAVPYDLSGVIEPLRISADKNGSGTVLHWTTEGVDADSYNVIRGSLGNISDSASAYDLGSVACIEAGSIDNSTLGHEDAEVPALGEVFFYLVEFSNGGLTSEFGTESAAKPRMPAEGECQ